MTLRRGVILSNMSRSKNTVIACYDLDGVLIRTYSTAFEASKVRRVFKRTIDKATRDQSMRVKNCFWRRFDIDDVPSRIEPIKKVNEVSRIRPVAMIDDFGQILKTFPSVSKAAKDANVDPHTLRDRINEKYKYVGKAKYRYLSFEECERFGYEIGGEISLTKKAIIQCDLEGKYIKSFKSINEASRCIGKSPQSIRKCLNGDYRSAYGFIWKYKDQNNVIRKRVCKIYQCDLSGKTIQSFKSVKDASSSLNISVSSINNCIRGRQKTAGGFIFKRR